MSNKIKDAALRLNVVIQDGYDLLDEFKHAYKRLESLLPDLPKSMAAEKAEIIKLRDELSAQSRELKQEIKTANVAVSAINGHIAWKSAVRACFGEAGLAQCYKYFEEHEELKS
jgi:hypothetical protein